ncbi:MAG TPA: hypothetical protein VN894_14310 [Polyangiaceae bacterium]|nr:hypothetical protein [Polyangiaceae bacterium]
MISRAAVGAIMLAPSLAVGQAQASDGLRLSVDWAKLADVLNDGATFLPHESPRRGVEKKVRSAWTPEPPWFGLSPHLSLVARDWSGAQLLVGHLMLTDELRLSRSCRMILSRVRIIDGRIAPFAQVGFGQWRVDTDLMPIIPADVEIAAQVGGGFELTLDAHAAIALETDYTILYREQHAPEMVSGPHPWVTFLAARAIF